MIGEGAFGKVVKAEYYSKPNDRDSKAGKIVAVKMLRGLYLILICSFKAKKGPFHVWVN